MSKPAKDGEIKGTIEHHRAPNFISVYATGVIVSSPQEQGAHHLIFYDDTIGVNSETIYEDKDGGIKTRVSDGDVFAFREDKVRVSMPKDGLVKLRDLLTSIIEAKE